MVGVIPWSNTRCCARGLGVPGKLRSRDTDGNSLLSFQGEKGDPGERVCSRRHQCGGSWLGGVLSAHPECEPLSPMCCLCSPTALSLPGQCQPSAHSGGTAKVPKWAGALRGGGQAASHPMPWGTCRCTHGACAPMQACSAPMHAHSVHTYPSPPSSAGFNCASLCGSPRGAATGNMDANQATSLSPALAASPAPGCPSEGTKR